MLGIAFASGYSLKHSQATAGDVAVATHVGEVSFSRSAEAEPPKPNLRATMPVVLQINGKRHELKLEPRITLLDALREHLSLTGTKKGCDHGQ